MLCWLLSFCLTITTAHAQYWTVTGNLINDRYDHTATLLTNGNVLVAGGFGDSGFVINAELYNSITGVWAVTGSLNTAREDHTATLLPNGNVLVAGGQANGFINNVELYNASTGIWTVTDSLNNARGYHTATLLPNGNVLVAGGCSGNCQTVLNSAELYNLTTGVWAVTGSLNTARDGHTATLLLNGYVLVAGGYDNGYLNSDEVYNPTTGVWTVTDSLTTARSSHTATLLPNGNVLVAGGQGNGNDGLNSVELYNPTTGVWTVADSLTYGRYFFTATLLPNGNVLVAAGYNSINGYLNSAELYNATSGLWTVTGSLTNARLGHTAILLANGNVLVAGGANQNNAINSAELYNPTNTTVTATPTTPALNTPASTPTPTSTLTPTPTSTSKPLTSTPTPTTPTPTSSSTSSTEATPTPTRSVLASSSNAGAIAGGIVGGLVGLVLLVLLLWLFRSRYRNKKEIKENASLDNSGYSQPMLDMSDVKSERPASYVSVDTQKRSSELMSNRVSVDERARSATGSSSVLSKSDDILIPFASLKLGTVLGQGNFGQVFQATYRGGPAAVKKLKGVEKQQIMEEAKMMKSVPNHPNVLQYFGVSEHEGEIMMVTELCDKGNLSQFLRNPSNKLNPQQYRQLCNQIASGMWHISTYGIVHRDLRAENILLSGVEIKAKVADFGLARSLQSRDNSHDSGYYRMTEVKEIPIAWTPPEVLNQSDQLKYVAASDVWSFGVVMWEIYSRGAKPFDGETVKVTIAIIRDPIRTTPLLDRPTDCPDDIFAIMNSCWAFNPQDRPTFEQLYNQLS